MPRGNDYHGFRLCMNLEVSVGTSVRRSDVPVATATPKGEYKSNYKLDDKGNAILCGEPCISPKPEGVLVIPDKIDGHTVTKIVNRAFKDCNKMTRIVLPPHLESILHTWGGIHDLGAIFEGCFELGSIEISKTNPQYTSENGVLYTRAWGHPGTLHVNGKKRLIAYPKNRSEITLSRDTTEVGWSAFCSCTFKTAKVPDTVESINYWAFRDCPNLDTIEFPKSVRWIGPYAFKHNTNMKKVTFHGDAPVAGGRTRRRENLFSDSPKDIVVEVEKGSKGWKTKDSTELPERWPTTGSDSRPIRYIK